MIEIKSIDLGQPISLTEKVIGFTAANDTRWAGIMDLPAHGQLLLNPNSHTDLYIIQGELIENSSLTYATGTFLSRDMNATLNAGPNGARLFKYQDSNVISSNHTTVIPSQLNWREGGAVGMKVASLINLPHELMLVSWSHDTRMRFHLHPQGEEIFVLRGELHDQHGRYPAGTWQRLHPETGHAPYSETDTLILLRNGHLPSQ